MTISSTYSSLPGTGAEIEDPALFATTVRLYNEALDAITSNPESFHVALQSSIRSLLHVTGTSMVTTPMFTVGPGLSSDPAIDGLERITREYTLNDGGLRMARTWHTVERGTMNTFTVDTEEWIAKLQEQTLKSVTARFPEALQIVLHWLVLEPEGNAFCVFRVQQSEDDLGLFTAGEIAKLERWHPTLLRLFRVYFKIEIRSSTYYIFAERAGELAEQFSLTPAEFRVLHMLISGTSNAQLARQLGISTATVKTHISHILQKTGCRNRNDLLGRYFASITNLP